MSLTRMQAARFAAQHVITLANERDAPITRELIEEVLGEETPYADANRRTIVTYIRQMTKVSAVPVALSSHERYLMHRAYMRHMDQCHLHTLRDLSAENEDKQFWDAFYTTTSHTIRGMHTHFPPAMKAWGYREMLRWSERHADDVAAWKAEWED